MKVGIVSYGTSIPRYRLKVTEINDVWHNSSINDLKEAMISEKTILGLDEDTITMAIESSNEAIDNSSLDISEIGAVYLGSCTSPYVSKASSSILLEALGIKKNAFCSDVQFSGKSGTSVIQICIALIKAGMIKYGLAVASDSLGFRTRPGENYEYYASSGAASLLIGNEKIIAEIENTSSYNTDTNDFFRLDCDRYIRYGGGSLDLGGMGFEKHIQTSAKQLMKELGFGPEDFKYVIFQQPNGVRPYSVGTNLGFKKEQITVGNLAENIGDCGSASSLLGLVAVLDEAQPKDRILLVSYGFGAGSDALSLIVTDEIYKKRGERVRDKIQNKQMINYATSILFERKYVREF